MLLALSGEVTIAIGSDGLIVLLPATLASLAGGLLMTWILLFG